MLKKLDFFGSQIQLRFNKEPTYKSQIGSIITILIILFISFRFITILLSVISRKNPFIIYTQRQVDDPSLFVVTSKSFPMAFALENLDSQYFIDEQIYTVSAQLQQRIQIFNNTSQQYDIVWNVFDIQVQPCTKDNFQNPDNDKYYLNLDYQNMYCFSPDSQLDIQGDFPSLIFSFITFQVNKCQINCKSEDVINQYLKKNYFGLQLSDAYVDITNKDNPFQMYSRDMFWPISTQQQKDITVYIRNNYVYSDFGWLFSDIITQKFPSYSYQDIDVFPIQQSDDYLLSVTFRFEKQQENVYRRSYLDFIGIISQIGGFAQSLLAIGYLICRKISQLQLNQSIINQIFNYEESETQNNLQQQFQELDSEKQQDQKQQIQQPPNEYQIQELNQNNKNSFIQEIYQKNKFNYQNNSNISIGSHSFKQEQLKAQSKKQQSNEKQDSQAPSFMKQKQLIIKKRSSKLESSKKQHNQSGQNIGGKQILNKYLQDEIYDQSISQSTQFKNNSNLPSKQINSPQKVQKKVEKEFSKLFNQQTNCMKMSLWQYFLSYFCPFGKLKQKKKIIQYSIDKLYQNLDILQILKRLLEVEKLKRLLLDPDQIKLLDYLPKPTIHLDLVLNKQSTENIYKNKEVNLLYQDNRSEMQKAKDAFEAYKKIQNKKNFSLLDQKLIDMLDQNLVQIFEAQNENSISQNQHNKSNQQSQQQSFSFTPLFNFQNEKFKNLDNVSSEAIQHQDANNCFMNQYDDSKQLENQNLQFSYQQSINNNRNSVIKNDIFTLHQNYTSNSEQEVEVAQENFYNNLQNQLENYEITQK
ncbi:small GTP-binding domain protein (macronuclear) [Tetrahymena thermophila SB210]|uniref:Small GTP-binding domain protein n=1 Tax=Tetrahymena thermophila (strain SB210) TaxID=312017 RepID=I7MDZ7_TETTS|nr:small GTP-binding domain protein [Tetrahymena thermophila SB210]EAR93746.2 small GTP-binding domain protein [Tetrahymena thermophila SB210]|eukprot:XP_001013991.2 small GTP-binding domain protein [Tetrahymena thermophila SB210]